MQHKVFIVTGVSGSGKTTVGTELSNALNIPFYDGDQFHPATNVAKMSSGIPLNDEDREPWLKAINEKIKSDLHAGSLVIACSALKEKYRQMLVQEVEPAAVQWIHLLGDYELIYQRMVARADHFMGAAMLRSQFETYEKPEQGDHFSIDMKPGQIVNQIINKTNTKSQVGLIGLGVMGTSLARNLANKGFTVSLFNRHVAGKEENIAKHAKAFYPELNKSLPFDDMGAFVASLEKPRKIIIMVNAGKAVDYVITALVPFLEAGDVLVECGNSHFSDTNERQVQLAQQGIHFVGTGVSGGEEGALKGPSIMPGGTAEGFALVKHVLQSIAARNEFGEICCDHIGNGGAGHFVKMVHNGIEYAEMQLLTELYTHLRYDQQKTAAEIADIFELWQQGEGNSYLLGITIDILRFNDEDGLPLIDKISDVAGNKGTGSWTTITASELGVPVPTISTALFARYISAFKKQRQEYSKLYKHTDRTINIDSDALFILMMFCRIINHQQGIMMIKEASAVYNWQIDTGKLLRIWSGGCIIRSALLNLLRTGWSESNADLLQHPYVIKLIQEHYSSIKTSVSQLVASDRAYPVISAVLEYFKMFSSFRTSSYLIQAQRDYFGAHTYMKIDDIDEKSYHTKWF